MGMRGPSMEVNRRLTEFPPVKTGNIGSDQFRPLLTDFGMVRPYVGTARRQLLERIELRRMAVTI